MNIKNIYNNALNLSKHGKYSEAIKEFDKFILVNPTNADALCDRGVAKYHINDFAGSLSDLNAALNLEPDNPYRYASRAFIRDCSGDTEGAIKDYKRSLVLDPNNAVSQNNLGMLEEKFGYKEKAKKRFKLADILSENWESNETIDSLKKQDDLVNQLLEELNIPVDNKNKSDKSVLSQMLSVLHSSDERKDFISFIKKLLRIR